MKTNFYLLFTFLLASTFFHEPYLQTYQSEIDSLSRLYQSTDDPEQQIDLLNEIAYSHRRLSPDSVLYYADLAIEASHQRDYKPGLAYGYKNKGIGLYKQVAAADTITFYYEKAISYAEEIDDYYTQAACYNNIGLVNFYKASYNEAVQYFLQGVHIFDEYIKVENRLKALMLGNLGTSYHRSGDNKRGIYYYEQALALAKRINELSIPSIFADELARARMEEGDLAGALRDITELMPLHDQLGDFESKAESLLTLSEVKMEMGKYPEVIEHAEEAIRIAQERGFPRIEVIGLVSKASAYSGMGESEEAISIAKIALEKAARISFLDYQINALNILSNVNAKKENYQEAYDYVLQYNALMQQNQDNEKQRISDEIEAKYQNEQNQKEIAQLKQDQEAQQKRFYSLAALTAFIILILAGLLYAIKLKNKATKALNEKNQDLQTAEHNLNEKNQELERYIESNLQLENFAHLASHDLREPMRNIVSFSQLLTKSAKEKLAPRELDYLNFIRQGTLRIEGLVKDLLDYSSVTQAPLELAAVDLQQTIRDVKKDVGQLLEEKEGKIEIDSLPETIIADPSRVYQLLQNLITNALRYSLKGIPPEIKITGSENGKYYHFAVSDNGIGIDPEFHDQIFVLFKTLENKSISNSSGIGLATCKKVVEDHGGKIWVDSTLGKGSTFHFTITKSLSENK